MLLWTTIMKAHMLLEDDLTYLSTERCLCGTGTLRYKIETVKIVPNMENILNLVDVNPLVQEILFKKRWTLFSI